MMVIQMVARQIGEDRAGEPDIAGPVLVKPVTGRLDHGTAAAVPKHSREKLLNAVRVRFSINAIDVFPLVPVTAKISR